MTDKGGLRRDTLQTEIYGAKAVDGKDDSRIKFKGEGRRRQRVESGFRLNDAAECGSPE